MPTFDLRGIKTAQYVNSSGTVSYSDAQSIGDAMNVNIELRFAEGRLYAESTLAEYMKAATGGTISIGVKYIPAEAQRLLFGSRATTRSVTYKPESGSQQTKSVPGLALGTKSTGKYVGVAFYAPDMIDGVEKYTCVKVARALFGPPAYVYQTKGENIQFQTPTTTGEFMADHSAYKDMIETATCDDEAEAIAWVSGVLA